MSWNNGSSELLLVSSEYEAYSAFAWLAFCESKTSNMYYFYFINIIIIVCGLSQL